MKPEVKVVTSIKIQIPLFALDDPGSNRGSCAVLRRYPIYYGLKTTDKLEVARANYTTRLRVLSIRF